MLLYPRLPREEGRRLILAQHGMPLDALHESGDIAHTSAAPAATGGIPVDSDRLSLLQTVIREVAAEAGYPNPLQSRTQMFDRPCGTAIYDVMDIVPADAAAEDVWSFISLVLAPEIGPWRFPERAEERLLGRPRNVLRRLWWRAWALGPDLDAAPDGCAPFGEDEFVGIMERPSIGGNPRTARAVRDAVWRAEVSGVTLPRSELAREITKRFRSFLPQLCIDVVSDTDLEGLLDDVAAQSVVAMQG